MTDLIRKDPKPLNRNRKPDLLRHGRTFHTAPDCRICSRCPGNRRSWKVSIAAWRGCSTTWWWSPCRPPCRLAQCSALQQSERQHVSGRQASVSTIRGVRLSVEPHRRQLKTFTPIDTKIRVNYLYAHPLESAAAVWSFCSLTTEHKAHGEPKSSLHVRIHTSPWVKKKKPKTILTIIARLLVGAVGTLGGGVALQSRIQTAAVCAGELLRCARSATFLGCLTRKWRG